MMMTIQIRRQVATKERIESAMVKPKPLTTPTAMRIQTTMWIPVKLQAPKYMTPSFRCVKILPVVEGGNFTAL
jgi:hypothetical protein